MQLDLDKEYYIKVCTLVVRDERVLLIKEKRASGENYLWNLPKGSFEANDLTVENAAKRECREEAGLEVKIDKLLSIYTTEVQDNYYKFQFCFLAVPLKETQKNLQPDEDIIEQKWFSKAEVILLREKDFLSSLIFDILHKWATGTQTDLFIYKKERIYK